MRATTSHRGDHVAAGDHGPSDRAGPMPQAVAMLSVHTSPLAQPGTGDGGGMNVHIAALAARLRARGLAVEVFTRSTGADLPPTIVTPDGVRVHHVSAGPAGLSKNDLAPYLCAFYLGVANHPALANVDLLHGHYWMSGWVGRKLRERRGIPLVQQFHTLAHTKDARRPPGESPESMLRLTAERRVVQASDAVIAATEREARVLRQAYGARARQVQVVPPGVDLELFHPRGGRDHARMTLGGGRLILFVGRLQPLKAPDLAVRALAMLDELLPDDGIPTRLVIVGGPSGNGQRRVDPPALRRLAAELGVSDRVALLAPRPQPELAPLYRAAQVVVMPSHSESFGLVALEALACGTPVVAADVGGIRQVVGETGHGTLVSEHTPQAFAAALAPYLRGAPGRSTSAAAAHEVIRERFSWTQTVEQTVAVYRTVPGGAAAATGNRRGA